LLLVRWGGLCVKATGEGVGGRSGGSVGGGVGESTMVEKLRRLRDVTGGAPGLHRGYGCVSRLTGLMAGPYARLAGGAGLVYVVGGVVPVYGEDGGGGGLASPVPHGWCCEGGACAAKVLVQRVVRLPRRVGDVGGGAWGSARGGQGW